MVGTLVLAGVDWTLLGVGLIVMGIAGVVVAFTRRSDDTSDGTTSSAGIQSIDPARLRREYEEAYARKDFSRARLIAHRMHDQKRVAEACEGAGNLEAAVASWVELKQFMRAAQLLEKADKFEKAAHLYREAGQTKRAADCFLKAGKAELAAELLDTLGESVEAKLLHARACADRGEHLEAARHFVAANDYESAANQLARAGEVKKAVEAFRRAGRAEKAADILFGETQWLGAAQLYEEAENHTRAALCYEKLGDWKSQARSMTRAGNGFEGGRLAFSNGSLDDAMEHFETLGPLDAAYHDAGLFRGQIYERSGRLQEAANAFTLFLEQRNPSPNNKVLFLRAAKLHEGVGRIQPAIQLLRRLVVAECDSADVRRWLNRLETKWKSMDATQAVVTVAQEVTKLTPATTERRTRQLVESSPKNETRPGALNVPTTVSHEQALGDRYRLIAQIGQGGNGVVYQATDLALERDVVVKFLHRGLLPTDVARKYFLREARTAARLQHPGIVTVYDISQAEDILFFSMEHVRGHTLADLIVSAGGRLHHAEIVDYVQQLAEALDYAHERDVIHRDIKPGNIMVNESGTVKLLDFGLAKALDDNPDKSVLLCGTPFYMSPEQIRREDLDRRTDIYSLGCLLYIMYAGDVPFSTGNIFQHHLHSDPPDPATLADGLPSELGPILMKCVSKKREDRFGSAAEIVNELAKIGRN